MKPRILFLASLLLAGCGQAPAPGVDTVFINGTVWTLDESQPMVEALAVDGNVIVYVGNNEGALALAGEKTVQHDLTGQMH